MEKGSYEGKLHIYCHDELAGIIRQICAMTLVEKIMRLFDDRICIHQRGRWGRQADSGL